MLFILFICLIVFLLPVTICPIWRIHIQYAILRLIPRPFLIRFFKILVPLVFLPFTGGILKCCYLYIVMLFMFIKNLKYYQANLVHVVKLQWSCENWCFQLANFSGCWLLLNLTSQHTVSIKDKEFFLNEGLNKHNIFIPRCPVHRRVKHFKLCVWTGV